MKRATVEVVPGSAELTIAPANHWPDIATYDCTPAWARR
jgi:hypothetical protein